MKCLLSRVHHADLPYRGLSCRLRIEPASAFAGHQTLERADGEILQAQIREHEAGPPGGGCQESQAGQARRQDRRLPGQRH